MIWGVDVAAGVVIFLLTVLFQSTNYKAGKDFAMQNTIYQTDIKYGEKLLEDDSVKLYDVITGLTNPIIFYEATQESSLYVRESQIAGNCQELLSILGDLEFNVLVRTDERDEWLTETLHMIQKAFRVAVKILPPIEKLLIREMRDALERLQDYTGGSRGADTKILTNVIPDVVKENIGGNFVRFNLVDLMEEDQHIRAPRFRVEGLEISLFTESKMVIDHVEIYDYSANIIVVYVLDSVLEFLREMNFDGSTPEEWAEIIQSYSDAITTQATAQLIESELLFNYNTDHNKGRMINILYETVTIHMLEKLPMLIRKEDELETSTFNLDENPIVKLQNTYKAYKGGLGLNCPPELIEKRNHIFKRGTSIVANLPRVPYGQKPSLLHYHFALSLPPEKRSTFMDSDQCIILLYGETVTNQLRSPDQIPLKITNVDLYTF